MDLIYFDLGGQGDNRATLEYEMESSLRNRSSSVEIRAFENESE